MTSRPSPARVAVLAPMVSELRPFLKTAALVREPFGAAFVHRGTVGGTDVVATVTGIGMSSAADAAARVLEGFAVDHVVVMGIAGGVDPSLAIGDVVVPARVIDRHSGAEYTSTPLGELSRRGSLITTDTLFGPEDVVELRARGVVAVDMETSAIAAQCAARGVPWSAFRSISDHVGDAVVDDAVLGLMHGDGSLDVWKVARFLVSHPGQLKRLRDLARGAKVSTVAASAAAIRACSAQ